MSKIQRDAEAADKCLREKWYALAKGEDPETMCCALCAIYGGAISEPQTNLQICTTKDGDMCPLHTPDAGSHQDCCDEFFEWDNTFNTEMCKAAARKVVVLLEAIRDAWDGNTESEEHNVIS